MKILWTGAPLLLALVNGPAMAAGFTLVGETHHASVVVGSSASPTERFAADELVRYVRTLSGVTLPIQSTDSTAPTGAIVIRRGQGRATAEEGYALSIQDGRLYVEGARDRAVLYAIYDLLERLGCRWLSPRFEYYGGKAEIVPPQARLELNLPEAGVVERPHLKLRKLYVEEGLSHTGENLLQTIAWMSKSRFNTLVVPTDYQGGGRVKWDNWRAALAPELQRRDLQIEVGGHGYQNFLRAEMEGGNLFRLHPEWFGLAGGKRLPAAARVFCTSNAAAVDYLTGNVIAYLAARPEIAIFDFWPPDGARWCECAECAKLGPPEDRQSRLTAHVIAAAAQAGIKARFECIAYSLAITPPTNPPLDRSVLVDFCPINQSFEVQINDPKSDVNARYASELEAWRKGFSGDISIYSYYRKYAWRSLPVIIPHYMQADLSWYEGQGIGGISTYAEPGDWRTYELNHYCLARLAWNPAAEVDALMGGFCSARFGTSAQAAVALYRVMEETVRHGVRIPGTSLKTAAELQAMAARLRAAREALTGVAGNERAADALGTAVEYALRDLALQQSIAEKRPATERTPLIDAMLKLMREHAGEGIFLAERRTDRERLMAAYNAQ